MMAHCRAAQSLVLSLALFGLSGCIASPQGYAVPGFAGVPEALRRSADHALPLSGESRTELVAFMAARGNRVLAKETRPEDLRRIESTYGAVLDRLQRQRPSTVDVREGTTFADFFDPEYRVLSIHNARVGWDGNEYSEQTSRDIRAMINGNFVFAFYLRRLVPVPDQGGTAPPRCWNHSDGDGPRDPNAPPEYTGLVVFPKTLAIPTNGQ